MHLLGVVDKLAAGRNPLCRTATLTVKEHEGPEPVNIFGGNVLFGHKRISSIDIDQDFIRIRLVVAPGMAAAQTVGETDFPQPGVERSIYDVFVGVRPADSNSRSVVRKSQKS